MTGRRVGRLGPALSGWPSEAAPGRTRSTTATATAGVVAGVGLGGAAVGAAALSLPGLVLVLLSGASLLCARVALRRRGVVWTGVSGRRVPPASRGVLPANPRSGGGKVERFGLVDAAGRRGVRLVLLGPR